jgi:hypothetical protein
MVRSLHCNADYKDRPSLKKEKKMKEKKRKKERIQRSMREVILN